MATKKTVWVADGTSQEFATEAEAIHWERILKTAYALRDVAPGITIGEYRNIAAWILTHFVPKTSDGPQAAYPPKVHGPGAPQPYAVPQAPSAVPPAPKHPVGACNCEGVGYYDASRHDDDCPYRASYGQ